jgi:hypothetical protein
MHQDVLGMEAHGPSCDAEAEIEFQVWHLDGSHVSVRITALHLCYNSKTRSGNIQLIHVSPWCHRAALC